MTNTIDEPVVEPQPTPEADAPRLSEDGPGITEDLATDLVAKIRAGEDAPVIEDDGRRARDAHGRFASTKPENDIPKDAEPSKGEAETQEEAAPSLDEERAAILRVGLMDPEDVASATPEQIQRWAEKAKAIKAERDREFAKLKPGTDPVEDEAKASSDDTEEADSGQSQPSLDIDAELQPFVEEFGDDAAAPFVKVAKALAERTAQAEKVAEEARRDAARLRDASLAEQSVAVGKAISSARDSLGERFAEAKDDDYHEKNVVPMMQAIAKADPGNRYAGVEDVPALLEATYRALGLTDGNPTATSASRETSGPKRAGLPITTAAVRKAEASMTPEQWQTELTGAIRQGDAKRIAQLRRIAPHTPL